MPTHVVGLQRSGQGLSLRLSCFQRTFLALLLLATWILGDTLGEILHFQSDIVLHFLQSLRVHKLCERIQLLLVEQGQKVIAKPTHFTVSIRHEIFQYSWRMWWSLTGLFNLHLPLQSLLLRLRFDVLFAAASHIFYQTCSLYQ